MAWTRITEAEKLPAGGWMAAQLGERRVVICNDQGTLHAFNDRCPHRNGPLSQGNFVDGRLICPWHAWEFLVDKGCLDYNEAITLDRYPVKIEDGAVWVDA